MLAHATRVGIEPRARAEQSSAAKGPELNNAGLGSHLPRYLGTDCIGCCHTWMNPTNLTYCACARPCLERHEFPQNAPSPTLKCCGGVKNHLRLATTGTLRSQLLPKTSRAHLPTSLLESPSFVPNPSLLPTSGTKHSGDSSRPSLPPFLPLSPFHHHSDPNRNQLQTWRPKRRRSVS